MARYYNFKFTPSLTAEGVFGSTNLGAPLWSRAPSLEAAGDASVTAPAEKQAPGSASASAVPLAYAAVIGAIGSRPVSRRPSDEVASAPSEADEADSLLSAVFRAAHFGAFFFFFF